MRKIYLLWVLCAYVLAGCSGGATKQEEHNHDHEAHEHEEGHDHDHEGHDHEHEGHDHGKEAATTAAHSNEIIFKEELAKAVGLQTKVVEPAPFTDVIKTSGSILAAQGDETTVVATVPGIVTFGNLSFVDGAAVRKGQAILSLASNTLSDGNVAARAKYAYENAKKEYERMEQLVGDKIVSAKDFEQARLNYENAKVAYEAVAGKQTANGVSVVSPMNGYLKNLQVKEGDYVAVGQPLATISQNSRLVLRAEVSEKYYQYLPAVQSANFRTPYDDKVYKLSDLHGRMLSFGKASDANSFYIPVTFEFDNKGAVIPGSFVEIYLLTSPMEEVLSVPVSSLIEEQGVYSVFIRLDEEGYQKREVKLGANNGSEVQILSGLKPGENVVTQGAYQIKLASASNAIPAHTHNH
ncbi:efflux RND transporter periplasmic adaptor subunit [Parabacteroides gordonii]|uniref:Efflux transporter, RND family, MFP subunit n=1 Tax=Parabacteroides gordonii MS-1 = DSM 23371 TaxID=1203610 RepID=A0A0F5J9B2_9BACT|nr:efflux RND transporter periplasmic adaptor subunit [Parabacteroides gordonii]KKB54075.1 efflux transporter, RND family, MFP subunit [Parabacteroides gordonii MS-1 = DSM 23371]MCA5584895.1 efflux RND transporter periplasmic adaptor subunit [Parabacteroides gordonii]RGP14182.1 efflux RND transporter periplasmic adaptor subunit [Parabacteroides gordonii]